MPKTLLKKALFSFVLLFVVLNVNSQKNKEVWEALLKNNREKSLTLAKNLDIDNDIENFLLLQLVKMENGIMMADVNNLKKLSSFPHYENYLFSHWKLPYFFSDYLNNGFDEVSAKMPLTINASGIQNSTVRNGLSYLQAISNRHNDDWNKYLESIQKIDAIRKWEYCGVFENLNSSGIDLFYPPEKEVASSVVFDAQSKGRNNWYMSPKSEEAYNFFINHEEYGSGVHYAQTFVVSPKAQRVRIKIGKNSLIRFWINDVLILENDDSYLTELDAFTYEVNLQKGVNRFLIKSATDGSVPYFIVRLEDLQGNKLNNVEVSFKSKEYIKSKYKDVNPVFIKHAVEDFFEKKIEKNEGDININRFCLFHTYYRNGKIEKATALIKKWLEAYPNSSFLKSCLMECYEVTGENNLLSKLQSNVKHLDSDYYLSIMLDFEKFDQLMKFDKDTYESKLKKIANAVDYPYVKTIADMMIVLREENREKLKVKLEELLSEKTLPTRFRVMFSEFYSNVFNDDEATIKYLKKINKEIYNYQAVQYLAYYYKKQNKVEDVIKLYLATLNKFNYDNNIHYELVKFLHEKGQYKRSLEYIDGALENFPNSYIFIKLKADALYQMNKKDEAIGLYEMALKQRPSNYQLRSKINDLKERKNPLNVFHKKELYDYIKENRKIELANNYGLNVLLDQTDLLAYQNGGGEYKVSLICKITSQNGIDIFKEYDLGLSGDYTINKSEIVKENGEIRPAEKSGSNLVFDQLEIGDVVYIDYEVYYSKYGRFYEDYIFNHNFKSYHPTIKSVYRLVTHDKDVKHTITNGSVTYKNYKKDDFYVHEWSKNDTATLSISEDYMPSYSDVTTKLHISSIDSWNEIATWYSDLVRKQLKDDEAVKQAFHTIFPEGYEKLSELERAKKIYYYITDNFNYSYVNFRQSGYVPQKPSKTIKAKLGDCKDFSTLFMMLARKAGLDARLMLILTSDYGQNDLVLPSTDFNHCIVKVIIDGKVQFLELTDKYLPFRALPISLRGASALEIPYDNSDLVNSDLFKMNHDVFRRQAEFKSNSIIDINLSEDESETILSTTTTGSLASYYINIFKTNEGNLLKDRIRDELIDRASETLKLDSILSVTVDEDRNISYKTKLNLNFKKNKIGKLYTFKVPYFTNPYNHSVISLDKRSYPIEYIQYENADLYEENIVIKVNNKGSFIEVPKNEAYIFKAHKFTINYKLLKSNELSITINSKVNTKNINPEEYQEFKVFVKNILDTRDVMLAFQSK